MHYAKCHNDFHKCHHGILKVVFAPPHILVGDQAPAIEATEIAINKGELDHDMVRSMIGWKALSSITHELVYNPNNPRKQIIEIAAIASRLGAPGAWNRYDQ